MTISTSANSILVAGTGALYSFAFNFVGDAASFISVTYVDADGGTQVLNSSQYSLTLETANPNQLWGVGGIVTYPLTGSAIAAGTYLLIERTLPYTQQVSIQNQGNFYPQVTERAMDILQMQIQQLAEQVDRCIQIPATDAQGTTVELPTWQLRANLLAGFDDEGNVIATEGDGGGGGSINILFSGGLDSTPNNPLTGSGTAIIADTGITAGAYTNIDATFNAKGQATVIASGSTNPTFTNVIITPVGNVEPPVSGLDVTLPAGVAVLQGVKLAFPEIEETLDDESITDFWLTSDGTVDSYVGTASDYTTTLPQLAPSAVHLWRVYTLDGAVNSIIQMTNTYATPTHPTDLALTIDNYVENFYLYDTTTSWSTGLPVTYGQLLLTATGNVYQVFEPGTTGASAPTSTAEGEIADGSAVLFYYCQSSFLGMFRYAPNNGIENYFTNLGVRQVCHRTLLTGSPLGPASGTTLASLAKKYIQGMFKHCILNRVNSGTYLFGMKMIEGGYIWLNTTVAGGTAAASTPFSGTYIPGVSTVVDGTITWKCIYEAYGTQEYFWMNTDRTFLEYRAADSHDSYASTLASLLARYIVLTADYSWISGSSAQPSGSGTYFTYKQVFDNIMDFNLNTQIANSLTKTFQDDINPSDGSAFTTQFLEDNCESYAGFRDAAYIYGVLGDSANQSAAETDQATIATGIYNLFDTTYNLFAIQFGQSVSSWINQPNKPLYPLLNSQFFPEFYNVDTITQDVRNLVRAYVGTQFQAWWLDKGKDTFPQNMLGYLYARMYQDSYKSYAFVENVERYFTVGGGLINQEFAYYLSIKELQIPEYTILATTATTITVEDQVGNITVYNVPATTSTPQYARLGLGQAADSSAVLMATGQIGSTMVTCTTTLNWNSGNNQKITLANGANAFTFANPKDGFHYTLRLKQPAAGAAGTVSWPAEVAWQSSTAVTLTATNGKVDVITFIYDATEVKYYGGFNLNY